MADIIGADKDLLKYISGYELEETPQKLEEIQGDFQLAGLSTLLNELLSVKPRPRVIDIGCGHGVLLAKLQELRAFEDKSFKYFGFDFPEQLNGAFAYAAKNNLLNNARFYPLSSEWAQYCKRPSVIVIRNVLHELSIRETAGLLYTLAVKVPPKCHILIQDMATLPVAEMGRAGWIGHHLALALEEAGMKTVVTPDTSKKGVDVFLIHATKSKSTPISEDKIHEVLYRSRKDQLALLCRKLESMTTGKQKTISVLRINHDIVALNLQLGTYKDTESENKETLADSFSLAFNGISNDQIEKAKNQFVYPQIIGFQNRSHSIQSIDDFLRSDKSIHIVIGGNFIGKKAVVWWALQKKKHSRLPIFINITAGTSIVSMLEIIVFQLGLADLLDVTIISSLKSLPKASLLLTVKEAISRLVSSTILILDGIESVLTSEGAIENDDVAWLIEEWSSLYQAKIIIESRQKPTSLPLERCVAETLVPFKSRVDSNYGKYLYTVQMLQELVPLEYRLSDNKLGGFPDRLVSALDNHPYLITIASVLINGNPNKSCLSDEAFVSLIIKQVAKKLVSTLLLSVQEKNLLFCLSLTKEPFPLSIFQFISANLDIGNVLLAKGLLSEVFHGRFRPLGVVMHLSEDCDAEEKVRRDRDRHRLLSKAFSEIYNQTFDPQYYRQVYFHATLSGDHKVVSDYNLPEISGCAETWYISKNFRDALWALENIRSRRTLQSREMMRLGSCLIRTNKINEGKSLYDQLLHKHSSWQALYHSYVDSLLYVGKHPQDGLNILAKAPEQNDYYWHFQCARCHKQLYHKNEAYQEYEKAILMAPSERVWHIIHDLVIYARQLGDTDTEGEWLDYAYNKLKLDNVDLLVELGSFYERMDKLDDAEKLLSQTYSANPGNAYCVLPFVKVLCRKDQIDNATNLLEKSLGFSTPKEIVRYAKVFVLKARGMFLEAKEELKSLLDSDRDSVHRWGQWADLHVSWSQGLQGVDKKNVINDGLKYANETIRGKNVPALMATRKLAILAGDGELVRKITFAISEINDSILVE